RSDFTHEEFADELAHIIVPPKYDCFYFRNLPDLEISSGSTTTHYDISLLDYEAFYFDDDHIKEISSGSTTTHSDVSLSEYDLFIFDLSNDQFPPTDRSDFTHEEFADELAHIIAPPKYDCFYFRNLPNLGELISILNSGIRENLSSTTRVNLPVEDNHSPLLAYVVWIFLAYLTLEVEKIVTPEDEEIEDDNLREKLLKVNFLIAEIETLKDNPTPSSEFLTKSSSTSPKSFLEETNTLHNSLVILL
nr:hypothetical protein [Tanacetum cinerariifolium]